MTPDVWLPLPPDTIEGLPEGPNYHFWNGADEFPADPADCAYYVVPYMKPSEVAVRPLPELSGVQVVQTLSAGIDNLVPGLKHLRPGVQVCNARGVHEASTAELALTLILSSLRGVPDFVRAQDRGEWLGGFRPALADRNVLIVGYGSIGSAIEDRLTPFEVARVARVARSERTTARGPVHPLTDLPALLPEADVVVLVTPLNESTRGLAGAEFLARMKDGALLVNVSRGPVVDTKALLAEVETGRITAALDVTDPEPLPPEHPLWRAPGVLISPHVGGPTSAFLPRAKRLLVDQLTRFVNREPLRNVILTTGATGA
ncbi:MULTISPECIES: 2-hydroxyacid dehydrogenase [unclassified Streptomyces]|uniref:2-hydroxyacid dehydrogenase n=1 Tax=unclassified Streptomyces TaxID=2593676 RepID=UPI00224F5904|nr:MULTISPECIES: 2-hydroxyacid dehydrogenase [unclassified Streptomyces]MCX5051240.1 2-hydroxyacid dehydrogenase [Streptomyces sp. NBC_00474]MCX5061579.1 2-hydroxyacid dehydrogenase [Streptomyces sp. NBC_00452]MCX5292807.1 2-hydroxyacid dehydrogenase [Streptomyces sp. NBC_00183]